jgi:hypothetical protein
VIFRGLAGVEGCGHEGSTCSEGPFRFLRERAMDGSTSYVRRFIVLFNDAYTIWSFNSGISTNNPLERRQQWITGVAQPCSIDQRFSCYTRMQETVSRHARWVGRWFCPRINDVLATGRKMLLERRGSHWCLVKLPSSEPYQ